MMSHTHIGRDGRFYSDRHPDIGPDKLVLSFHDYAARDALREFLERTDDKDLARDIERRLDDIEAEEPVEPPIDEDSPEQKREDDQG